MIGSRLRKPGTAAASREREEPQQILIFSGNPMNGTAGDDFMFGLASAATDSVMNGGDGDDFILGDSSNFRAISDTVNNGGLASAFNLDSATSAWTQDDSPIIDRIVASSIVPGQPWQTLATAHVTAHVEGTAGQHEWFAFSISQSSRILIDVDYGVSLIGGTTNLVIELYRASDGELVESSDTSGVLDPGSHSTSDPYITTDMLFGEAAGTYLIRIYESGASSEFEGGETFLLHVSVEAAAHATGAAGPAGADTLSGDAGEDELIGAGGNDTMFGGSSGDILYGGLGNDLLYGEAGGDVLRGNGGADILDGGASSDDMYGGDGDDTYYVDSAFDEVFEFQSLTGGGSDRVVASVNYTLPDGADVELLEAITLSDITSLELVGNFASQTIIGNAGLNVLRGKVGADTLIGAGGNDYLVGGEDADLMIGGMGDDAYYVDDSTDLISDVAGEGNDRIAATVSYALAADAYVERIEVLTLTTTYAIDLTGSGIANVIYGNDGQNILRGEAGNDELRGFAGNDFLVGGGGTDLMVGGLGNDTFYVDDASDAIGENEGEGSDRIAASVSFVLSNGANVEILEAVNLTATTAFDLTGSDSGNTITGNAGVNILRGEGGNDILSAAAGDDFLVGGSGQDQMSGGTGHDTYYVDHALDIVIEGNGQGSDRVVLAVSFALASDASVEVLETATQSGTDAIDLTGSDLDNLIRGNDGFNRLDGKGGNDTLVGFGGTNGFAFTTALGPSNVDTIVDFEAQSDQIGLDDAIFTNLGAGGSPNLPAGAFKAGTAATEADDRIIYNQATGQLFYDADGDGAGGQVLFAILQGSPSLSAFEFTVI